MSIPRPLIDDELLAEAKVAAKREGRSLRAYVRGAIRVQIRRDTDKVQLEYDDLEKLENELHRLKHAVEEVLPTVISASNTSWKAKAAKAKASVAPSP